MPRRGTLSTGRSTRAVDGPKKRTFDDYPTPPDEVARGLRRLAVEYPAFKPRTVLEPGAGRAVFCSTARDVFPSVKHTVGVDIRRLQMKGASERVVADFLNWDCPRRFNLVASNPPYRFAEEFLTRSLECLAPDGICILLLRLGFLGSEGRQERLWKAVGLRAVWLVPWRIKFINGHSDREYCAWFVFDQQHVGAPTLGWIDDTGREGQAHAARHSLAQSPHLTPAKRASAVGDGARQSSSAPHLHCSRRRGE